MNLDEDLRWGRSWDGHSDGIEDEGWITTTRLAVRLKEGRVIEEKEGVEGEGTHAWYVRMLSSFEGSETPTCRANCLLSRRERISPRNISFEAVLQTEKLLAFLPLCVVNILRK